LDGHIQDFVFGADRKSNKLAYWFQSRRFLNIFPIGSYVKTMSADGGHLGWRFGSLDIITGFRGEDLKTFFP
jgi:hypothetical protein